MFILFSGDDYYPAGGAGDLVSIHDTLKEARTASKDVIGDWWHIFDLKKQKEVDSGIRDRRRW
jgi:hypothetical protein